MGHTSRDGRDESSSLPGLRLCGSEYQYASSARCHTRVLFPPFKCRFSLRHVAADGYRRSWSEIIGKGSFDGCERGHV